jgi:organic hydroperoxide reductase OsmC/OhrA
LDNLNGSSWPLNYEELKMQPFPHHYTVAASAAVQGDIAVDAQKLPRLVTAAPSEYGGPGDRWSPETLLVGAVADCFVLTFRAIAAVSKFSWISLDCEVTGTLDRVEHVTQFTGFVLRARLKVSPEASSEQALRMLTKAEQTCLVTNSLKSKCELDAAVDIAVAA